MADADEFRLFTTLRFDPVLVDISEKAEFQTAGWNYERSSPIYMLDYHRDRISRAASYWQWNQVLELLSGEAGLETLSRVIMDAVGGRDQARPHRVKVLIDRDGIMTAQAAKVPEVALANLFPELLPEPSHGASKPGAAARVPLQEPTFAILVDVARTDTSEYTHFKTSHRPMYDAARQRTAIALTDQKEVLLVNQRDDTVMEGSIATPYFWRNGRWVTPPVSFQLGQNAADSGGNAGTTRRWAVERSVMGFLVQIVFP